MKMNTPAELAADLLRRHAAARQAAQHALQNFEDGHLAAAELCIEHVVTILDPEAPTP